jgi:hypothetical protein
MATAGELEETLALPVPRSPPPALPALGGQRPPNFLLAGVAAQQMAAAGAFAQALPLWPLHAQQMPPTGASAAALPLWLGPRPVMPRPVAPPGMQLRGAPDVAAEKLIVDRLVRLLARGATADSPTTPSPWRLACCKEYVTAVLAAFVKKGCLRLPSVCGALVADFLWCPPLPGVYLRALAAQEGGQRKSDVVCKRFCRHGTCTFSEQTGRPCTFYHPSQEVMDTALRDLAEGRSDGDLWRAVTALQKNASASPK